jgi:putative ABC transport system permease protein
MVRLARVLSLPHLRRNLLRSALSVTGVAAGVAAVVGMTDVGASVLASFEHALRTVAGDAELEVSSPAGGLDETLVQRVGQVAGVEAAAGIIETFVPLADDPGVRLYLLGIDFLGSPVWETQFPRAAIEIDDELTFVARVDSAMVTRAFAARVGLDVEGALRIAVPAGVRALHVRGFLDDVAAARLFAGALAIMDLPAAQLLLGRGTGIDRIAVKVAPGATVEETAGHLEAALGPAYEVAAPELRGEQAGQLTASLRALLLSASFIATIVGGFVVYHSVALSLWQRRRQLAIANAVGVSQRALSHLCVLETMALAATGCVFGVVAGRVVGRAAASVAGQAISDTWLEVDMGVLSWSADGTLAAIALGLGIAFVAAWVALRASFRATTVEALRPVGLVGEGWGGSRFAPAAGAILVASTWFVMWTPSGLGTWPTAIAMAVRYALGCAGVGLMAPWLVSVVGRSGLRLAQRWPGVAPRLAMASLPRTPGRSGSTVATIVAATAITANLAGLVMSFQHAWLAWIEQHFAADLMVGGGGQVRLMAGPPMAAEIADALSRVPGVATVEPFRLIRMRLGDRPVFLQGISLPQRLEHGGLPMVEGDLAAAAPALAAGTGVLLSDNLAYRLALHRGDMLEIPAPGGPRRMRVEGTFVDFLGSLDLGAVVVSTSQLAAVWGDSRANLFRVWLADGASMPDVRARILTQLGSAAYYVISGREFVDGVREALDRFFLGAWAMIAVSGLVGVVGVVNAQVAAVADRATEFTTLRMVGVSPRTLRRSVVMECGALGLLGGLVGVGLGTLLGIQMVRYSLRAFVGWSLPYVSPGTPLLLSLVMSSVVFSVIAGWIPARTGARLGAEVGRVD